MRCLKICIACSVGGHLNQIMELRSFYSKHDYYFLTFWRSSVKKLRQREKVYFIKDVSRNVISLIMNSVQSFIIFLKERPDLIISTGAGIAVVTCLLGWLSGKKIIFIEDWCRVSKPSLSGRLIYPIAHLFFVQWKELLKYYPKAVYKGILI